MMDLQQSLNKEGVSEAKLSNVIVDNLPRQWKLVKLSDHELFAFENGLWTGKKEPFIECPVIRNTNFSNDGSLNLSNVAIIPIEQRQFERKRLIWGDIIIERSGGGPQQPVGRVVFFNLTEGNYCFSNFTTRLRVIDKAGVDSRYLHLYLFYFHNSGQTEKLQNRTTGIRNLAFEDYKKTLIPLPPPPQQRSIAYVLQTVQEAIQTRRDELELEHERKAALMQFLFTHGTHREPLKQTEIGEIPESWSVLKVGKVITLQRGFDITRKEQRPGKIPVISSSGTLSYHDTAKVKGPGVIIGRKGSIGTAFYVEEDYWPHDTTLWVKDFHGNDPKFVYYFLKSLEVMHLDVGSSNPTLNRNHVHMILVGLPMSSEEQREIAEVLEASDKKINTLEQEAVFLEELFRALLEELMTGGLSTLPLVEEESHE
jgi:type I restriction enzyme, S subunit